VKNIRLNDFEPPAIIQEKKKYQNFTIKPIDDIHKWRAEQANKRAAYELRNTVRDQRITQNKTDIGYTAPSPSLSEYKSEGWEKKLAYALERRKQYGKPEMLTDTKTWTYEEEPEPKKTVWQRIKAWAFDFWISANF